jgi:hypothetical protein
MYGFRRDRCTQAGGCAALRTVPYPSSLDIMPALRTEWRLVYYHEPAAFAEQAASGRFRSCAHGCGE